MVNTIEIEGTPYCYSSSQDSAIVDLATRVEKMREAGTLSGEALAKIRKFFRIKNIYHSNAIEGNVLDVGETRQVVEQGLTITGKPLKDQAEAKNLSAALDFLESLAGRNQAPITENDVRQIHHLILMDIDNSNAGKYRTVPVEIGGSEYTPPGPEAVAPQMQELGEWLSQATSEKFSLGSKSAILAAAAAHTWFVTVHPFIDGNGRVGRLLLNLILMRAGFPIAVITKEDRLRYYDALEESQTSDLTAFISLLIESIGESLEEYEEAAKEQREMQEWAKSLASKFTEKDAIRAKNEFEVWRNAMELLKSYFRQAAELLDGSAAIGNIYFKDFGVLEYEKYLSLRAGGSAKKTWFFRIDFRSENRSARYLFFFGSPSYSLRRECDVTLHLSREEPAGSFHYERLDKISSPNVPDIHELGYKPESERFVVRGAGRRPRQEKLEALGRRFFDEVVSKHFSNN